MKPGVTMDFGGRKQKVVLGRASKLNCSPEYKNQFYESSLSKNL
jgi:hypothetical protein